MDAPNGYNGNGKQTQGKDARLRDLIAEMTREERVKFLLRYAECVRRKAKYGRKRPLRFRYEWSAW